VKNNLIIVLLGWMAAVAGHNTSWAGQNNGDPVRGAEIYGRCIACHSLNRNRTGPKHCGLFGRTAGTLDGYRFSKAMRESGIVWTGKTLDTFLENPRAAVPRTKMGYAGIEEPQDRADLIAYLQRENEPGGGCSQD
jgi:cytochrome c